MEERPREEVDLLKLAEGLVDRGRAPGFSGVEEGERLYHQACQPELFEASLVQGAHANPDQVQRVFPQPTPPCCT